MSEGKCKPGGNLMVSVAMKSRRAAIVAIWSLLLAACAVPSVGGEKMGQIFGEIECDMTRRDLVVIARASDVGLWCVPSTAEGNCHFKQDGFTHGIVASIGEDGKVVEINQVKQESFTPRVVGHRSCE